MNNFELLGLCPELLQAVTDRGYQTPTPIQSEAIPPLLNGEDVLGQAQTGTGKTAAFALPMLQMLDGERPGVQALVLTPTRELAIQVSQAVYQYGAPLGVRVLPIYGGQSYQRQITRLQRETQVVVGTPGRTLDLIRQGAMTLDGVQYVVLDEADEMLKMGFVEDVEAILSATPKARQTAMFSATMSKNVLALAARYMRAPLEIRIASNSMTVPAIEQRYHLVNRGDKLPALALVLEAEVTQSVLIFTKTRIGAAELAEQLTTRGYTAEALHGDLDQQRRETVLRRFKGGQVRILIGTDVMARGVDIPEVSHVINYDLPVNGEDYTHRIGRTGRAGRTGIAITLLTPSELGTLESIQRFTKQPIQRGTLPTPEAVYQRRDAEFLDTLDAVIQNENLNNEAALLEALIAEGADPFAIASAAIRMARATEVRRPIQAVREVENVKSKPRTPFSRKDYATSKDMVKLWMSLGQTHGIHAKDVVGAVANEAGISGKSIGAIDVMKHETFFDVKAEVVNKVLQKMQRSRLRGEAMNIRLAAR